jgi:2-hydroxy-6-oxonona-2,4-dienedioate hydrolase
VGLRNREKRSAARALIGFIGVVALILAGWISLAYQRDIRQASERVAAGGQIAQTPCGPIEYVVAGEGRPVLMVHGAGGGYDQGLAVGEPLIARGFRVISVSRFGYLRTPMPADGSAAAQARAHVCMLDALDIDRSAVIGVSAGASSAIEMALRYPDRTSALILLVPAAYVPRANGAPSVKTPPRTQLLFETALRSDFLFWVALRTARPTMTRAILATPPEILSQAGAAERARVHEVLRNILPVSRRRLGLLNDAAVTSSLVRPDLEQIAVPTLILSTTDDLFGTFDSARYTAAHVPNARFVGYPSGGHLFVGHQEDIAAEIAGFLR